MVKHKRRREREEDRKREEMTESERGDEVQRKKEEKKKGVKAETCFCADMCLWLRTQRWGLWVTIARGGLSRS